MPSWTSFPPEIRNQILDHVSRTGAVAACAAVSREWQAFVEPRIFRRLVLNHSCVAEFGRITHNRKWMVQHIWLRIELPRYRCTTCSHPETPKQKQRNNQIFTKALFRLLEILASWEDKKRSGFGPVDTTRPVLELSVHSPSDMKHRFDVFALDKDVYPHQLDEKCTYEEFDDYVARKLRKDFSRGQVCRAALGGRASMEHLRMFAEIEIDLSTVEGFVRRELPMVNYISALIIRRQYYRSLNPGTVAKIARCFHNIGSVMFEPISRDNNPFSSDFEQGYKQLLLEAYRFGSLSIFQGHYGRKTFRRPWKKLSPSLSLMLADESEHSEHLSVAFASDASAFFQDFLQPDSKKYEPYLDPERLSVQTTLLKRLSENERQQVYSHSRSGQFLEALLQATGFGDGRIPRSVYQPKWPRLKTLALTSRFADRFELLEAAAFAALQMPQLQTMEIWGGRGLDLDECFRYSRGRNSRDEAPTITWFPGLDIPPPLRVIAAWDRVAKTHAGQNIRVLVPEPPAAADEPKCPFSVLGSLELRETIAHPLSLREFEWYYDDWTRPVERLGVEDTRRFHP